MSGEPRGEAARGATAYKRGIFFWPAITTAAAFFVFLAIAVFGGEGLSGWRLWLPNVLATLTCLSIPMLLAGGVAVGFFRRKKVSERLDTAIGLLVPIVVLVALACFLTYFFLLPHWG